MELDIDFENYSVPNARKKEVRTFVEALKQEPWVNDLKTLVMESGVEDLGSGNEPTLPGMLEETKARIYRAPEGSPAHGFEVLLQGTELKVYFERKIWIEVHFLPKGADFLVFYVEEASFDAFVQMIQELDDLLKSARNKKSGRAADWKARFATRSAAKETAALAAAAAEAAGETQDGFEVRNYEASVTYEAANSSPPASPALVNEAVDTTETIEVQAGETQERAGEPAQLMDSEIEIQSLQEVLPLESDPTQP